MSKQCDQERAFELWQQKKTNEGLYRAVLQDAKNDTEHLIRVFTKYDNLFKDCLDGNKQYVSSDIATDEFVMAIRRICRILDTLFE